MEIYINIQGDGSVLFVSSSGSSASKLVSYDTNGSGKYVDNCSYTFLTNKILVSIASSSVTKSVGPDVTFSTINESFTVLSNVKTSSINVLFTPQKEQTNIFSLKPNANATTASAFNFSNYTTPINIQGVDSGVTLPTSVDYEAGYMFRYFYKISNDTLGLVREVNKIQFDNLIGNYLYKVLSIRWKIAGEQSKVKEINSNIIELADQQLPGIKLLLQKNLLQYWKNSSFVDVAQFDVTAQLQAQNTVNK